MSNIFTSFSQISTLTDTTVFPVVENGLTRRATGQDLKDFIGTVVGLTGATGAAGVDGATGAAGTAGVDGATGPAGAGIAAGGQIGQILAKKSLDDYDTEWINLDGSTGTVGGTVSIQDEGIEITATATTINFVGEGVEVTSSGTTVTVEITATPLEAATTATIGGLIIGHGLYATTGTAVLNVEYSSNSETPPADPREGDFWWDTVGGRGYIRYIGLWVEYSPQIQPAPGPTGPIGPTGATGSTPNFSSVAEHIIPAADLTYDLGTTSSQWRSLYVGTSTVYFGGIPLRVTQEGGITVNNIPVLGGDEINLSITVPAEFYKGFGARYGRVYDNDESDELTVSKIVIFKEAATTNSTIDPTSGQDNFAVTGLGASDVVAMFVLYGDTNDEKSVATLKQFARTAVDNVLLAGGVEGEDNTIEDMRAAFYTNINTLTAAAGGLVENFEFYINFSNTTTGATTVREGSGAVFEIGDNGLGAYTASGVQSHGTNYRVGHKILILGTALGGSTPDNDCVITVDSISGNGEIEQWSVSGVAAGVVSALYAPVTGTNYQVGSGAIFSGIGKNDDGTLYANFNSQGSGYVAGDVLTLPGSDLQSGVSPLNNITLTVTSSDAGDGRIYGLTVTGVFPTIWRSNSISDGGADQYDTANFINTNLATEISYNGGAIAQDATAQFGAGSKYVVVYDASIFGILATGSSATTISTSGNSGADGESTTDTGELFEPEQTYNPALTNLTLTNNPLGVPVNFVKTNNGNQVDVVSAGLHITRGNQGWLYNNLADEGHDDDTPTGSVWNNDGWDNLSNVESRTYRSLNSIWGGNFTNIVGSRMVMKDTTTDKYWAIEMLSWTQGQNGGGFAYTRREINLDQLQAGIRFADGTVQTTAYVAPTNVISTAPGNRRIETVVGHKQVAVTARTQVVLATTASRSVTNETNIWVDTASTTIDTVLDNYEVSQLNDNFPIQFSIDNVTWYNYTGGRSVIDNENVFFIVTPVTYNQGDAIYFRYTTGGFSEIWWDKSELPGGSSDFRGAIIDYHAWTGESTIIGTIHIVDDDGENHITHTEVTSGQEDGMNDNLWIVENEGRIRYARFDGEEKTLKIHWTGKVFYGSEYYDD